MGGVYWTHPCTTPASGYMPILKWEILHEEGLDSASCLFLSFLLICSETCVDPSAELKDGPLGPLLERSYPDISGRPGIVRYPIPPYLLTKGGIGELGLELLKELVWSQ